MAAKMAAGLSNIDTFVPYKLTYFPLRGRAEGIRLLLEDNGIQYEETEVTGDNWPKLKPTMAFGQCPAFYDGDLDLYQSNAILRYLARKHAERHDPWVTCYESDATAPNGIKVWESTAATDLVVLRRCLYGSSDVEATLIDMINDGQEDLRTKYIRMIYGDYDNMKPVHIKALPEELGKFENLLKKNNKGDGFFVGDKISFLDYNMADLLDIHLILAPGCLDEFPALKGFYDRMMSRPNIAKYRETEGFRSRRINYNGKQ